MERALIQWLKDHLGPPRYAKPGVGDDAAVLPASDRELVLTTDAICEGVHFRSTELSHRQIGRKALAVNLSDLASMGARPRAAVVSLAIPRSRSLRDVQDLYLGMKPLADRYGIEICGGDTTVWDGGLVISLTAIGTAPRHGAWTISEARPGDRILVTGEFGGSIREHHWAFEPRCAIAELFRESQVIRACTDVSDSLSVDLVKIAVASGVGFEIMADSIPVSDAARQLASDGQETALQHALSDGEDFELILVVSENDAGQIRQANTSGVRITDLGCFLDSPGYWMVERGERQTLVPRGYEHQWGGVDGN